MVDELIEPHMARLNLTYDGLNVELPDLIPVDADDGDIRQMVTEALHGGFPGMPAAAGADLTDFAVERFAPSDTVPYNRVFVRPKVTLGSEATPDA